jgi:hypothetical protein
MAQVRRKHAAVIKDFKKELQRLENFDADNQANFRTGELSKAQLRLLSEAIFFSAFRAYENYIRDIFILYCLGKSPTGKQKSLCYLQPKTYIHAEHLLQSGMPYLDWTSPDTVIQRAELYLKESVPIKLAYTSNLESLRNCKRLRNHIAHNSKESLRDYKKVLKSHYGIIPLTLPSPGEYLLFSEKKDKSKYKLLTYFGFLNKISTDVL